MNQLMCLSLTILQTILCGMGELHIEIIHDRIRREYGIETHLGPLQVAYRETILNEVSTTGTHTYTNFYVCTSRDVQRRNDWIIMYSSHTDTLDRTVGDRRHVVTVELAVRPVDIVSAGGCEMSFTDELERQISLETKEAVENGVCSSHLQGMTGQN